MTRPDDNDVKDQELQIKIQENERLQREVCMSRNNFICFTFVVSEQILIMTVASKCHVLNECKHNFYESKDL